MTLSFRSLLTLAVLLVAASAAQSAPPPAPEGWQLQSYGDVDIYRVARDGHRFEMRLFPAETVPGPFDDWFAARIAKPVQGVLAQRFVASRDDKSPDMRTAFAGGRDGKGAMLGLARVGCRRQDGKAVLSEMVFDNDEAFARSVIEQAFKLFGTTCHGGAQAANAGPGAQAAAPAPAEPVKPEAPRRDYAFQTDKPGTGIKRSQIETILMFWRNDQAGMTMQVHTFFFLVLKDGSFRDGLPPAAFEDVDVAAAKKGEPDLWGKWTRKGDHYELVWPGNGGTRTFDADAVRQPAKAGEKLEGVYKGFSAYSSPWSVSTSEWSVEFTKDGHFLKSANRSVVGSLGGGATPAVGGTVRSDDNGSQATMGGPNFATAQQRNNARPKSSRSGTYKLDGYTLELDYDNGVVERRPFCAVSDRSSIWFEGDELSHPRR